jgi:hypothetical protein
MVWGCVLPQTHQKMLALFVASTAFAAPATPGFGRWLLDAALKSPLYKAVLVPQAKRTMVSTAEENGVAWTSALAWLQARGPWVLAEGEETASVPAYYTEPFHAYEEGNLCWEAALEGEIASRAVGARNFPDYGADGEPSARMPSAPACIVTQLSHVHMCTITFVQVSSHSAVRSTRHWCPWEPVCPMAD